MGPLASRTSKSASAPLTSKAKFLPIVVLALVSMLWLYEPTIEHAPGVLSPSAPTQVHLSNASSFEFRGYLLKPVATFSLEARVLSRKSYRHDRESDLSPIDLALGWGPMSDSEVLQPFRFSQWGRWYRYKTSEWTIPKSDVVRHSANMHFIPSSPELHTKLESIVVGHIVLIEGTLVNVRAEDGWRWNTSISRKDDGAGSCEVIWLTSLELR